MLSHERQGDVVEVRVQGRVSEAPGLCLRLSRNITTMKWLVILPCAGKGNYF